MGRKKSIFFLLSQKRIIFKYVRKEYFCPGYVSREVTNIPGMRPPDGTNETGGDIPKRWTSLLITISDYEQR